MLIYCATLIGSAVLATCLTWAVRGIANRFGLTVGPTSARHIHARPIPRLGGMAIFLTFAGISLIYTVLVFRGVIHAPKDMGLIKLLAPAAFLFFVGLVDDLWGLGAKVKLAAQVGGA